LNFPLTDPQKLTFQPVLIYDCLAISKTRTNSKPKRIQTNRPIGSMILTQIPTRTVTRWCEAPPIFSPPLEKLLDIVKKIWALLRKLFGPRGVPSRLRAWSLLSLH